MGLLLTFDTRAQISWSEFSQSLPCKASGSGLTTETRGASRAEGRLWVCRRVCGGWSACHVRVRLTHRSHSRPSTAPADLRAQRTPAKCKLGSVVRGASLAPVPLNGQQQRWWEKDMASLYLHGFQIVLGVLLNLGVANPPDFRSSSTDGVHRLHRLPHWPPGLILLDHLRWPCSSLQTLPDAIG